MSFRMEAASLRLNQILLRAEGLGVRPSLPRLAAAKKLLDLRPPPKSSPWLAAGLGMFLRQVRDRVHATRRSVLGAAVMGCLGAVLYAWLWWWPQQRYHECLVGVPDSLTLITRPPVDCSMCRGISAVDRVQAMTPEDFELKYAYTGRPVVVQDAMTNWTAPSTFSFNFLKSIYAESLSMADSPQDRCQFFPYSTDFRELREVFDMHPDRAALKPGSKPWYVGWSNCDERVAMELRRHYGRPYFLPNLSENKNVDWIFMGSPGYGAQMHVDNVRHPSWQAQLQGAKLWSLQPPPECFYECQAFTVTVAMGEVKLIMINNFGKNPIIGGIPIKKTTSIVVLDTNRWYHSTKIVSQDISITIGAEYD